MSMMAWPGQWYRLHWLRLALLSGLAGWLLSACLNFGSAEQTTEPSAKQIARATAEMYLNPQLQLHAHGYRYDGRGIDARIWFKFSTDAAIDQIFDNTVVDINQLSPHSTLMSSHDKLPWWDVGGKPLLGAQVQLPYVKFMQIGIDQQADQLTVYLMWFEV